MRPESKVALGSMGLSTIPAPFLAQRSWLEWEILNSRYLSQNAQVDAALFRVGMQAGREWGSGTPPRDQADQGEPMDRNGERRG